MLVLHNIPIIPNKIHYCWPPLSLSLSIPVCQPGFLQYYRRHNGANQQHWDTIVRIAEDHCFGVPLGYPTTVYRKSTDVCRDYCICDSSPNKYHNSKPALSLSLCSCFFLASPPIYGTALCGMSTSMYGFANLNGNDTKYCTVL